MCVVLQPLRWRCVDCVIHHEWDVREAQQYIYVNKQYQSDRGEWSLLLLGATVWSFAHMSLGLSDRNKMDSQ